MYTRFSGVLAAAAALVLAGLSSPVGAAEPELAYPAISGFGGMHPLPDAAVQPDESTVYKAVFEVSSAIRDPAEPYGGLDRVARAVNIFASAGVPLSHLKFVAVLHGPGTPAVLDDEHYRAEYDLDNPNIALIAALKKAGVEVEVCGQALAEQNIEHAWVNQDVTITLSALSDLIVYAQQGYTLLKL
jgi:intracellular sulfur oxidation DsrE/DsrF family protein